MAKILLIEPFYGASHKQWADGWKKHSKHEIRLLTLSAHHWKWRMHGAAVTLASLFLEMKFSPDWIVASDMLDLTSFLALSRPKSNNIKTAIYFHENQLTYPWSPTDDDLNNQQDNHYKFINYTSALAADLCLFNSEYHKVSFLEALPLFLKQFPDHKNIESIDSITYKSKVLPLGLDLRRLDSLDKNIEVGQPPILLWNHRWEYDKNPAAFFAALFELKKRKIDFQLIVLGQKMKQYPSIFDEAKERLKNEIIHWGYCERKEDYAKLLWLADILPVTSIQDFFGGSVVEAVYCNTVPLLPCRLAYPEHFPFHPLFYYDSDEQFVDKLAILIQKHRLEGKVQTQELVKKYDWESLVGEYDLLYK